MSALLILEPALEPEPAVARDLDDVLALLRWSDLPTAGVEDAFPRSYSVTRHDGEVCGVAGLERYGDFGLLRSVAVRSTLRSGGLGRRLVEDRLVAARRQDLESVYLLTTTAAEYFRRLGFADHPRDDVPASVQRSPEFASICPSSAVCLSKRVR